MQPGKISGSPTHSSRVGQSTDKRNLPITSDDPFHTSSNAKKVTSNAPIKNVNGEFFRNGVKLSHPNVDQSVLAKAFIAQESRKVQIEPENKAHSQTYQQQDPSPPKYTADPADEADDHKYAPPPSLTSASAPELNNETEEPRENALQQPDDEKTALLNNNREHREEVSCCCKTIETIACCVGCPVLIFIFFVQFVGEEINERRNR